ncbi:MAG: RsmB/NOP family class I SAM-dependent RNA methyltransferase [Chitinophagales bacterium]
MQEIKIHQPIIDTIIVCLKAIFEDGKVADKEVNAALKLNKNFGSRDRSMIAECVYDVVRWKLKYEYQLSAYNADFTLYKHLVLVSLLNRNYSIKNPELFSISVDEITKLQNVIEQSIPEHSIAQSYPKEFYDFCEKSIGKQWHLLSEALNQKPKVFIRTNTLKTTKDKLLQQLTDNNIETRCFASLNMTNCIEILSKNNLRNSDLYKEGLFEFQDIGSQAIGSFLFDAIEDKTKLNEITILDLCAGAGGKTLHLSALLQNKGKIYATDYKSSRLKNLEKRTQQAGCSNIQIIDFKEIKKLKNLDVILMDAPCSGSGTFKRQADLKYKITSEKINEYQNIQESLLQEYKNLIHKNGKIIYATCSILPQENQLQILNFIKNNPSFKLEKEIQLLPVEYDGDGFYMACLSK